MSKLKIEWVHRYKLCDAETLHRIGTHDAEVCNCMVPVVRLSEVDTILREAVWAMELVWEQAQMFSGHTANEMTKKSSGFLTRQDIADWRARQKVTGETT